MKEIFEFIVFFKVIWIIPVLFQYRLIRFKCDLKAVKVSSIVHHSFHCICFTSTSIANESVVTLTDSKYGSFSSCYPSTVGSSLGTVDSPNALSSPEQLLAPFIRPTKVAKVQKISGFSSSSTSSDNAEDALPKRKLQLKATSDISVSSGESQDPYFEHNLTPYDLSSREVTHLEPPDLRSTSVEESFSCFQLSGESYKPVSSSFSLPDPLPASPSDAQLPEPCSDASEHQVACLEETEKQSVDDEKRALDSLPKWVKCERKKQIGTIRLVFINFFELFTIAFSCIFLF